MHYRAFLCEQVINETFKLCVCMCVREIERHWGRQSEIKSIGGRQRDREQEGTLSIKTSRVSTWLITSLHDTSSTEEWRDRGRRAESFIIIRKKNVAIPVGRHGAGDKEYLREMSLPSTPQPTDLFQGQWSREVGGFILSILGFES